MPFDTSDDAQAFLRLLRAHPEWRAELRRELLTEELLGVPARLARVETALAELAARLEQLTARVDALAEAQARTEAAVERLVEALRVTRHELGQLSQGVATDLEALAERSLEAALVQRGYRALGRPWSLALDGAGEIDVVLRVARPDGTPAVALVEARRRVDRRDAEAWGQRAWGAGWRQRLHAAGVPGPYLPYLFAHRWRLEPSTLVEAIEEGRLPRIGLLDPRGELLPAPDVPAATA